MIVWAHRGAPRPGMRENSLSAFTAAIAGSFGVESDVRLTRDGVAVLYHDPVLSTRTPMPIRWMTSRQLSRWGVPTVSELVDTAGEAPLCLDLKDARAVDQLARECANRSRPPLVVHKNLRTLARLAVKYSPTLRFVHEAQASMLASVDYEIHAQRLVDAGIAGQNTHVNWWTSQRVTTAHAQGLLALGSLINDRDGWLRATRLGLDGICTDDLALVRE